MIRDHKFVKFSGCGCRDCKAEIARIAQIDRITYREDDPPFRYDCPSCGSVWGLYVKARSSEAVEMRNVRPSDWKLIEAQSSAKCTRCGKSIRLYGTFGSLGDSEPEGTVTNGAAYCWDCAEKTARVIEGMAS
jgi:Zn finger protein HypA/HybF involved in hydrogenase expression